MLLAWDLFRIRSELSAGQQALDELTLEAAGADGIRAYADDAASHIHRADDLARGSVPLRVLGVLPVVGDQVDGVRRLTGVVAEVGDSGAEAAAAIDERLSDAGEPAGRIALLDEALAQLDRLEVELQDIDLGEGDDLLGPLARAHDDLADTIDRAEAKLSEGRELIEPVRTMLEGPSTYLLLAANNAEMAAGTGLTLSAGVMRFDHGDIILDEVVPARSLRLPDAVAMSDERRRVYRPVGMGIDFRSTTRSPNLPAMGPLTAEMYAEVLDVYGVEHHDLDGVVVVDAIALRDVMALTGPVTVDGVEIDAENVLAEVLNENYNRFEDQKRAERDSFQGDIARAVFDSLTEQDVPAAKLAKALLTAGEGRHLQLWSADPAVEAVWEELGVAGELPSNGLMVAYQNYGANKLDWYLRPETALDVGLTPNGDYRARLTMTVEVPALEDLDGASTYVLGPSPESHGLFLTAYLPEAATDISTPHPRGFRTKGSDGPLQVRTFLADVALGERFTREIDFTLPRSVGAMLLLPSGRAEPMPLTVDGTVTVTDATATGISWLAAAPSPPPDDTQPMVVLVLLRLSMLLVLAGGGLLAWGSWQRRHGREDPTAPVAVLVGSCALVGFAVAALLALMAATPTV